MELSKINRKLPAVIVTGLMALVFAVGSCNLPKKPKRQIEPIGWADVNRDGFKDAIIKKGVRKDDFPFGPRYDERLMAVDGRNIKKEREQWITDDSYNILIGAFGHLETVEGLSISPKRQKWRLQSYIPLHARTLASGDGKFSNVCFEDDGLRISAEISTNSRGSPPFWPNRYNLSDIRSLGYKMNDLGEAKKLE